MTSHPLTTNDYTSECFKENIPFRRFFQDKNKAKIVLDLTLLKQFRQ